MEGQPLDIAGKYWLTSVEAVQRRLEEEAASSVSAHLGSIGRSFRNRTIPVLRIGSGPTKLVVVAAMHGYEVVGTYACLALAHSLLSRIDLDGRDVSAWADETLAKQSIYLAPMASPDVTARFFQDFPSGHIGDRFSTEASEWENYSDHFNQPRRYFQSRDPGKQYLHGFSSKELQEWTQAGRPMGLRWTEQGVDPWQDWENFSIPETRALRDFLIELRPDCVFEIHNHELPSSIYLPIPSARGEAAQKQLEYGEAIHNAAVDSGLPYTRHSMHTYHFHDRLNEFPDWALRELGCLVLWGEMWHGFLNDWLRERMRKSPHRRKDADTPPPSEEEMIRLGSIWLRCATELGNELGYK